MKQLPRDPMRFDVFDVLAKFGREHNLPLDTVTDDFISAARASIERSLQDERLLHGLRTQAMFEALVVSLGRVKMLKQEDSGDAYFTDDTLKVPDFRLVLEDGQHLLVEVKGFHKGGMILGKPLRLPQAYADGLARYANEMRCALKVAVYWTRLNTWTMVDLSAFRPQGRYLLLSIDDAMRANEMALLGDLMLGTRYPLTLRVLADPTARRSVDEHGRVLFTISDVKMYCAGQEITDPDERSIAFRLMLFGDWHEENEASIYGKDLQWIEFCFVPPGDSGHDFAIVGSLSSIFSRTYALRTLDHGRVKYLRTTQSPARIGSLVPKNYRGTALPLWQFTLQPS